MPVKKETDPSVWIVDVEGVYAKTDQADYWTPQGWKKAPEPGPQDLVWLRQAITGGKAKFAYTISATWSALGWELSEPPTPVDLTKDHKLVDVVPVEPEPEAPKKAASGSKEN